MAGAVRTSLLLVASALVTAAVVLPASPPAGAAASPAAVVEVGWWSRHPAPSAPEGGFEVATGPGGDIAVAALRVDVEVGVARALLVLEEAGGIGQSQAAMRVCPTAEEWEPATGGDMASAPHPECGEHVVELERDPGQLVWRADVRALLPAGPGVVSLMVVPSASASPLPLDPGFEVELDAARVDAAAATPPASGRPASLPPAIPQGTASAPSASFPLPPSSPVIAGAVPRAPSTDAGPSVGGTEDPARPGGEAPTIGPADGETARRAATAALAFDDAGAGRPWGRLLVITPAAALAGLVAAEGRRRARARGWVARG